MRAMRSSCISGAHTRPAKDILFRSHGFEMSRIDAFMIAASMIDSESFRDRTNPKCICRAMCADGLAWQSSNLGQMKASILPAVESRDPVPAFVVTATMKFGGEFPNDQCAIRVDPGLNINHAWLDYTSAGGYPCRFS